MARSIFLIPVIVLALCGATGKGGKDPKNPTCPSKLNWSPYPAMRFTVTDVGGEHVLLAEGVVDNGLLPRLSQILQKDKGFTEIWLRSPGGVAVVGNEAGRMIRKYSPDILTRIPKDWACASACNFMFMGGKYRVVEPGGHFVVHMFTHIADREAIKEDMRTDADDAVNMIGEIEQDSAMLASEDNDFLIRMGVSRKLLTDVMYQQRSVAGAGKDQSTRRCMTSAENVKYNVTNAQ